MPRARARCAPRQHLTAHVLLVCGGFSPEQIAADTRTGHAFVLNYMEEDDSPSGTTNGTISMLDTRTGRLLRTIAVPGRPYAVAIDEQTGRAFVKSDGLGIPGSVTVLDATR